MKILDLVLNTVKAENLSPKKKHLTQKPKFAKVGGVGINVPTAVLGCSVAGAGEKN